MRRVALAVLAVMMAAMAPRAGAQQQDQGYQARRAQLLQELDSTQKALGNLRGERTDLAARIDNVMAQLAQQRALVLTLSGEQGALLKLDSLLTIAQDQLGDQHERLVALGDALKQGTGAMLVVLFRADSGGGAGVQGGSLAIDGAAPVARTYTTAAASALGVGAVDEVFRGAVLPSTHKLAFTATVNGQPTTQTVEVSTAGDAVTYVQFTLRNGQLVPTTWTSRGTTPF